jgi:hypothetical protein
MPFTLAHPAAVVPLRRRLGPHASLSALVLGSMTPDLAYFVPIGVAGAESHSLGGLLWYCLPAGLLAYLAFHALVRPLVIALLPVSARARLGTAAKRPAFSLPAAIGVTTSLLVGAASHLAWDSFTHSTGFAVQALPPLRAQLHVLDRYPLPVWSLLQYVSSVVGLLLLGYWARRWYAATDPAEPTGASAPAVGWRLLVVLVLLVPATAAATAAAWHVLAHAPDLPLAIRKAISRAAFSGGTVFLASLALTSVAWRLLAGTAERGE